jgi:hypothetical protein
MFGLLFAGVWLVKFAVVLPAGGGFGAFTIPLTGCAVEGVGRVLTGTELVTGRVEAVGETLVGLPSTLFGGCGMLAGVEGVGDVVAGTEAVGAAVCDCVTGCAGSGSSGSVSVTS